jgi:glycosyltransferase involved in cell wall biosynthesis
MTKPKKILLIAPQPFFLNRGTPLNVLELVRSLGASGYVVDLLVYPIGAEVEISGVTVIRSFKVPFIHHVPIGPSWNKLVLDFFFVFKAFFLACIGRYDVFHGIEEGGFIAGILGFIFRKPYVFDMDSCMSKQLQESGFFKNKFILRFIENIESYFIRNASAVLTVCTALSEHARLAGKDVVIYQIEDVPVDSVGDISLEKLENLRREINCENKRLILYTGNLEKYQGIDLLLEGFAEYLKENHFSNIPKLLIVGGDTAKDKLINFYQNKSLDLKISDHVIFTGPRPREEMGLFMELADVLVSPRTEGENTPLKIYSYLASGKPTVATKIKSHTQVLDDTTSFLAEPNAKDLGIIFNKVLDENVEARKFVQQVAQNAKRLVEEKYSRKEFSRKLGKMYEGILN